MSEEHFTQQSFPYTSSLLLQHNFHWTRIQFLGTSNFLWGICVFNHWKKIQGLHIKHIFPKTKHTVKTFEISEWYSYAVFKITILNLQLIHGFLCHYISSCVFCPPSFPQLNRSLTCFWMTHHWFYLCYLVSPSSFRDINWRKNPVKVFRTSSVTLYQVSHTEVQCKFLF